MASNMIATSARFDPFSYNEMLAPVAMADTEHKAIQEDEGKLQTLTEAWRTKLNQTTDPIAYKQYTEYLDQLKQQASSLAANGLNPNSRQAMLGLRTGYSTNILPIEEAYTNKQKGVAFQNDLRARDNSVVFNQDFSNTSIDDFIKNPTLTSKYASGASVLAQVSNQAKAFADQLLSNPKSGLTKANHGYLMQMTKEGVDPAVIDQIINSDKADTQLKGIARQLKEIRDNAVHLSGVNDWGNEESINKIKGFGNQGLYSALGKTDIKYMDDWMLRFGMEQSARARELQVPQAGGYIPSTNTYFDINSGEGKDIQGVKSKLFNERGEPLTKFFSTSGKINPLAFYEKHKNDTKNLQQEMNQYLNGQDVRSLSPARQKEFAALAKKKQTNYNVISESDYNMLKSMGVKPTDTFREIREKMHNHQIVTQHAYTNYDLKLSQPALEKVDKNIQTNLNSGISTLVPIDDKFKLKTGSTVDSKDYLDGIKDDKKPNIVRQEFSPKLGGIVVHTQGGKKFLVTRSYSDQTDNYIKARYKGTGPNDMGLEYALKQASNFNLSKETREQYMQQADIISKELAEFTSHIYSGELDTQDASETSSKTLQQGFR